MLIAGTACQGVWAGGGEGVVGATGAGAGAGATAAGAGACVGVPLCPAK
jgi:hypothetical protein